MGPRVRGDDSYKGLGPRRHSLIPPRRYDLDDGAVRRPEAQRRRSRLGDDLAAMLLDNLDEGFAVGDFQSPMMDARARTCRHYRLALVALPLHQRDVEVSVGHVARNMEAIFGVAELFESEHGLVEIRRLLQVVDLEREVNDARRRAALTQFIAADLDNFRHAAVRRTEFERAFFRVGENLAAILDNLLGGRFAILDLDTEMVDAGSGAGKLRLRLVLIVIGHQREIDRAFGHVPRRVTAGMAGLELIDAEDVLVEFRRLLQVVNLKRDVNDTGHVLSSSANRFRHHSCA